MTIDPNAPAVSGRAGAPAAALPDATPSAAAARWWWLAIAVLGAIALTGLVLAWKADQRGASLEPELVRRQQASADIATQARTLAKQAQEGMSELGAKIALLDARVAEVAVQRGQLEELIQSLSRSRDENLLVDVEASLRVGLQQTAITGSAEPLVAALTQGEERLARYGEPRLEGVRRAIARDLNRVKAVGVADIASLGIKLDEAIRLVDELPLLAQPDGSDADAAVARRPAPAPRPASGAADATEPGMAAVWVERARDVWDVVSGRVWNEVRSLVRVSHIEHPDAMLLAPEQAFFVRENLKLRLLNARLALLSRQFEIAQSDLLAAQQALRRYFDRASKRTLLVTELIRQVVGQARHVGVPRPDDTLAAIKAASAGR